MPDVTREQLAEALATVSVLIQDKADLVTDGGIMMPPEDRWRRGWVPDADWLAALEGEPLEVPHLIECMPVAGRVL